MKMWIARNEDGSLALFKTKPICFYEEGLGRYWAGHSWALSRYDYPEVTFENSPMKVELRLIKK